MMDGLWSANRRSDVRPTMSLPQPFNYCIVIVCRTNNIIELGQMRPIVVTWLKETRKVR